jgi:hypothetical protein
MIIKNVGKNKFVVPAGNEAPSKKYPKGRKLVAHVEPGQHVDLPDVTANKLLHQFPEVFVEFVPTKAKPKPAVPGPGDGGPDGPEGDKKPQKPAAPQKPAEGKIVGGEPPLPSEAVKDLKKED